MGTGRETKENMVSELEWQLVVPTIHVAHTVGILGGASQSYKPI